MSRPRKGYWWATAAAAAMNSGPRSSSATSLRALQIATIPSSATTRKNAGHRYRSSVRSVKSVSAWSQNQPISDGNFIGQGKKPGLQKLYMNSRVEGVMLLKPAAMASKAAIAQSGIVYTSARPVERSRESSH